MEKCLEMKKRQIFLDECRSVGDKILNCSLVNYNGSQLSCNRMNDYYQRETMTPLIAMVRGRDICSSDIVFYF